MILKYARGMAKTVSYGYHKDDTQSMKSCSLNLRFAVYILPPQIHISTICFSVLTPQLYPPRKHPYAHSVHILLELPGTVVG